jgi:predicted metal-dependent hydrolase
MSQTLTYKLKKSKRAKRLRLAVYCDGSVVVTTPSYVGRSVVEKFIAEKKQWILDKIKFYKNKDREPIRTFSYNDYLKNKHKAYLLVRERIDLYNKIYGYSFNRISIKNQKTRWGSCSSKKNLNFNYKIVFLSERQRDYIIVHELCHLGELNHSKKFWALVEKTMPEHRKIKAELRRFNQARQPGLAGLDFEY